MASVKEIILVESSNVDEIHLFREGIFYKAYERSAFAFVTHFAHFEVKKKFVKNVASDIVSIGFPTSSIDRHFNEKDVEKTRTGLKVLLNTPIDLSAFETWKNGIKSAEPIHVAPNELILQHEIEVIKKLRDFPLEIKTPLECLVFLSALKNEL